MYLNCGIRQWLQKKNTNASYFFMASRINIKTLWCIALEGFVFKHKKIKLKNQLSDYRKVFFIQYKKVYL